MYIGVVTKKILYFDMGPERYVPLAASSYDFRLRSGGGRKNQSPETLDEWGEVPR